MNEQDPIPPVNGGTACYAQWTNTATGNNNALQGLRIGINGAGVAEIRQQENLPLVFFTNNFSTARMIPTTASTLAGNPGMMGIGNFLSALNPIDAKLDIDGDLRIRTVANDNSLTQILAIDPNDLNRVKWIDAVSVGNGVGNYCSQTQNGLTENFEIPLNTFNYYFSGQGNITRTVGIGLACNEPTFAKLHVRQTAQNFLFTPTLGISAAGYFHNVANGSILAYGALGSSNGNNSINIGVYGEANGATINYAGYFEGDVYVNGGGSSGTGYLVASDQQFKTNVVELNSALAVIMQLNPKTYYLDTLNQYGMNFPSSKQYGFIAQDVEQILPEIVSEATKPAKFDSLGNIIFEEITYKTLNYDAIIPILTKGIQEQQIELTQKDSIISNLNDRLTQLENCLSNLLPALCQANQMAIQQTPQETQEYLEKTINITLSNRNNIVLNQNVPNPFAESTVISYSIPSTVQKAQIHFYDGQGKLINSVEITERGNGQLNVFANDISTGFYTYSLVADGQVVATKRMVKE